ncbi:MAG TPA: M48 family metalloprotease [Acidimicrobiales bacterium]|nr:M48 family metalloprotease [Acidimicrobiales bacterium]
MRFVLRRSLPSIGGLVGLLLLVGFAAVGFLGAPLWFPVAFAIVLVGVQYAVNPLIIQWLVPATVIPHDGLRYDTDHPLGAIVARRCADAGVPLVTLGIVDDGNPNAFTFGRTPKDARMWVTRGLLERLDERELDAVVTHEVGHVKHWDFAVMTVAAVIPMVLYLTYLIARGSNRAEARAVAIGTYAAYLVSQLTLLGLSRARETAADHWSCECTGDGDALASALVKVAYGMGQVSAAQKEEAHALIASGKEGKREAAAMARRTRRAQSMRAMGIFEPRSAEALQAAFAQGIDPDRALAAMRWDVANPWGATLEKLSSHPLVAHRILDLEESGLPGAPKQWSVLRAMAGASPEQAFDARARFARELALAVAPWAMVIAGVVFGFLPGSRFGMGLAVAVAGLLFFVKQHVRYPGEHAPVDEVAGLLERLDAGPVAGIGVTVKGRIVGRGMPGYVLSPDLVVADASGFVPLLYRQPLPFAASFFGLFKASAFQGQEVVARGWYRRLPGPAIELRDVHAADGRSARSWEWVARYAAAAVMVLVGVGLMLVGLA